MKKTSARENILKETIFQTTAVVTTDYDVTSFR